MRHQSFTDPYGFGGTTSVSSGGVFQESPEHGKHTDALFAFP